MPFAAAALNCALSLALVPVPPGDPGGPPLAAPAPPPGGPGGPPLAAPAPGVASPTPAPRLRGTGLIVGAAITGGLGLVANAARIGLVQRSCDARSGAGVDVAEALRACIQDSADYLAFSALAPLLNLGAAGLSAGAGVLNARYRAREGARGGAGRARAPVYIGVGASLLGLGALTYAIARVGLFRDLYGLRGCATDLDPTSACVRSRWSGWLAGIGAGQAAVIVGAGLLAFGVTHRLRDAGPRSAQWQLRPAIAPTYAGLSVETRF